MENFAEKKRLEKIIHEKIGKVRKQTERAFDELEKQLISKLYDRYPKVDRSQNQPDNISEQEWRAFEDWRGEERFSESCESIGARFLAEEEIGEFLSLGEGKMLDDCFWWGVRRVDKYAGRAEYRRGVRMGI